MLKKLIIIFNELRSFFNTLNILSDLNNLKPKIVFFSESKSYQKYSKPIIDILSSKYTDQIYYLSIDKEDVMADKRVKSYVINKILINFFFKKLKANNLFLTVTDLGNNLIKKTNNIDKYIYYFHSPVSTTKNYTPKAFDNYDIIMCNGQFQIDEIKSRENLKELNKKKLIPSGYFYFDHLNENINHDTNFDEILIAPSWNKNIKNFLNENFIDLIDVLLKKNFKVVFRPHPEHFKRSKKILNQIINRFLNENFIFDKDIDNIKSMEKAKCLITDSSGIAIEYMIVLKRPVLYLDEHDKIHNPEFKDYSNLKTIDQTIKQNFGYLFKKKDFNAIDLIIDDSENELKKKLPELNNLINKSFFNYGTTKNFFLSNLKNII